MTALILLAAGMSERFGDEDKLLAKLNGKPIIEHVIDAAEGINYRHRLAVVSKSHAIENICKSNGYDIILNDNPELGQGRSIALGAKQAMKLDETSICILLGDMPFISAKHLERLLMASQKSDCVFSTSAGVRLPPTMFSGQALKRLTSLNSGAGAKSIFSSTECAEIALPSHQAQDIDTQIELRNMETL